VRPRLVHDLAEYRRACDECRRSHEPLGFVPTLGALHHAHQALMRAARELGGAAIVSIFVNPTQFGPSEDFQRYPRDLEGDLDRCEAAGVDLVFAPSVDQMYPRGEMTRVRVSGLTDRWEGKSRPGHFEGVATVVAKLLSATGPCHAVFGRKDYQQLQVVKRLATDLLLPVRVVEHPTLRDGDGLATSSRNRYLSPVERARALALPRALGAVGRAFDAGERRVEHLAERLSSSLLGAEVRVDYAALVDSQSLEPLASGELQPGQGAVLLAAEVGSTRLIDNTVLGVDTPPVVVPADGVA
jgi:pantoate--beta-alanine ligase